MALSLGIEVIRDDLFTSYQLDVGNVQGLHGQILCRADSSGHLSGDWKVSLGQKVFSIGSLNEFNV